MAHPCISCGSECYCHGDIDDVIVFNTLSNCETCGCNQEDHDDDEDDYEPEYYQCLGCGWRWSGVDNPGTHCPRCAGVSIDGVF